MVALCHFFCVPGLGRIDNNDKERSLMMKSNVFMVAISLQRKEQRLKRQLLSLAELHIAMSGIKTRIRLNTYEMVSLLGIIIIMI